MKQDIVLAGVGGQGILSIAAIIAKTAVDASLNLKQSEVHGMAQRGGAVIAHLRLSSSQIYSDLIPGGGADLLMALEPLEAVRQLQYLSASGRLIANRAPVINMQNYPDVEKVCQAISEVRNHVLIDADALAREAGSARSANMVMLGALSESLQLPQDALLKNMEAFFSSKGDKIVDVNRRAFQAGSDAAREKAQA